MYGFLQVLQAIAQGIIQTIQPLIVPLCFVMAWGIIGLSAWSLWAATRDGVRRAQRMHKIPCAHCRYFSGNYLLKCPVHPQEALSEAAIGCGDFESTEADWRLPHTVGRGVD